MAPPYPTGKPQKPDKKAQAGFTLLELLVVLFIVGLLAVLAVPAIQSSLQRAREAALMENLTVMRRSIDAYYGDKWQYPESLDALVEDGYLKFVPVDPVLETESEGWDVELDPETSQIIDVHSRSRDIGTDGRIYKEW